MIETNRFEFRLFEFGVCLLFGACNFQLVWVRRGGPRPNGVDGRAGSDRLIKTVYHNLQGGYMEYKNVIKTIIGVATGKPIGLILNLGERKELRDFIP